MNLSSDLFRDTVIIERLLACYRMWGVFGCLALHWMHVGAEPARLATDEKKTAAQFHRNHELSMENPGLFPWYSGANMCRVFIRRSAWGLSGLPLNSHSSWCQAQGKLAGSGLFHDEGGVSERFMPRTRPKFHHFFLQRELLLAVVNICEEG